MATTPISRIRVTANRQLQAKQKLVNMSSVTMRADHTVGRVHFALGVVGFILQLLLLGHGSIKLG
jgi:hypothetical protein